MAFFDDLQLEQLRLFEGGDGGSFIILDVKDRIELGQLQQIVNLPGQLQQLDLGLLILCCGKCAHQFAQP
jgi:hypothetical protein